ncbi:39S ribosomal protein L43, mitochondrial [Toxorhynchites rutilus septentrionalis]|uniref:39S ribosomal protein L43, mitochondrial n=1 Tax=Toxorhynchites rutilus septentrionalis TaxID=329112 RepID=UPI00247A7A06|nr:39S ribosomal protein L43, mitochondrial [Toxorhynchites rutilus septentrionalis]
MSNSHLFLKSGFPRAPLANGIGRYVCQLQRITLKYCKNNGSSKGMREFLENDLVDFSRANPGTVVYVKPRRHRTAVMSAEYLNGEKQWINCRNMTREEIGKWVELLRTQAGAAGEVRLRKLWHTDIPSIQGAWTPFTHQHPSANTVNLPSEELSRLQVKDKTATERLLELYRAQKASSGEKSDS